MMKLAIHHRMGSFSNRWIAYCEQNHIEYRIVNAYANDIIQQVEGCDCFMWHFHQGDYRDMQFAKSLILSLEAQGVTCFPDSHTCWHFDDKIAQKYLLESIGAPLVPSYVFYTKKEALDWVECASFPKVFKLKGGAGSANVKLAKTQKEAIELINQCFGKGFAQYRWQDQLQENYNKFKENKRTFRDVLRPVKYAFRKYPTEFAHYHQNEIGYAYFQDFVDGNNHDTRVVIVGCTRAMAEIRYVREGDFRASGSGNFEYGKVDENILKIAFDVADKLKMQTVAFDFILSNGKPKIIEISYGFGTHGIRHSGGYWSRDLQWHEDNELDFSSWIIENLLKECETK